jgi:hypothetical protein
VHTHWESMQGDFLLGTGGTADDRWFSFACQLTGAAGSPRTVQPRHVFEGLLPGDHDVWLERALFGKGRGMLLYRPAKDPAVTLWDSASGECTARIERAEFSGSLRFAVSADLPSNAWIRTEAALLQLDCESMKICREIKLPLGMDTGGSLRRDEVATDGNLVVACSWEPDHVVLKAWDPTVSSEKPVMTHRCLKPATGRYNCQLEAYNGRLLIGVTPGLPGLSRPSSSALFETRALQRGPLHRWPQAGHLSPRGIVMDVHDSLQVGERARLFDAAGPYDAPIATFNVEIALLGHDFLCNSTVALDFACGGCDRCATRR